jgi:dTMP kinase
MARMSTRPGRFIVLEGADGCGKSTQARLLTAWLEAAGHSVLHVRDPGSTRVAEAVRSLLLDPATGAVSVRTETLLYMAARAQLAEEVILPAMAEGTIVVCERWTLSTEVYQGRAGGLGVEPVRRLAELAEGGAAPDLTLVLDVPEGVGLSRLTGDPDRMESKGGAFHAEVVRAYRELALEGHGRRLIPSGDLDDATAAIRSEVSSVVG